jgi:hypothetical protein
VLSHLRHSDATVGRVGGDSSDFAQRRRLLYAVSLIPSYPILFSHLVMRSPHTRPPAKFVTETRLSNEDEYFNQILSYPISPEALSAHKRVLDGRRDGWDGI